MKRPELKDFLSEDATIMTVQGLFTSAPELYRYIQALDTYIDSLEEQPEQPTYDKWSDPKIRAKLNATARYLIDEQPEQPIKSLMKLQKYEPTKEDIERYPHFAHPSLFYRTDDGIYDVIVCYVAEYLHLKIHRVDDQPIHNYMDIQQIKNLALKAETTCIEIYPAQSQFKDGSNTYHLWTWRWIEKGLPNLADIPKYW